MEISDARRLWHDELTYVAGMCSDVLVEAREIVAGEFNQQVLAPMLARACDFLDQLDTVLVGLSPSRDSEAFGLVARLHRELEQIQALVPRQYRRLQRTGASAQPALLTALRIDAALR